MDNTDHRLQALRRLALACAVLVLAVTSLSAFMRQTKAGLGCPDWPACYGQQFRDTRQGIPAETGASHAVAAARLVHRVAASLALLLTLTMVLVCFASRPWLVREGLFAVALVLLGLLLAVLGRWSSTARVPGVAMCNLLGGFLMLGVCARLAAARHPRAPASLRSWTAAVSVLLLMQIALGSLVSSSFAGMACTGWGDCGLADAWRSSGWASLDPLREPAPGVSDPGDAHGVFAHSLHQHLALLLAPLVLWLSVAWWRHGRRVSAGLLSGLVVAQVLVGWALAAAGLPLPVALLHNVLAALLFASLCVLA